MSESDFLSFSRELTTHQGAESSSWVERLLIGCLCNVFSESLRHFPYFPQLTTQVSRI